MPFCLISSGTDRTKLSWFPVRSNMGDDLKDSFVPIKDGRGNVTGMMDRATSEYLASKASDPNQGSIDSLLRSITRVRVVPFSNYLEGTSEKKTLLDTSNPASLASFRACFAINEDPATFGHCMCFGDPHIELHSGDRLVATFGYHHGFAIRWDAWKHDARLKEPERLLEWMSAHGVHGPRDEVESIRRSEEESERHMERWLRSMPECFLPFWDKMDDNRNPEVHEALLKALRAAVPSQEAQSLALLAWFGSGEGPWSGYPSYERVPEMLLLHYPTKLLIDVLTSSTVTESQLLGASRYFAGWGFRRARPADQNLLSASLKLRLLEAVRKTGIANNVESATRIYGD